MLLFVVVIASFGGRRNPRTAGAATGGGIQSRATWTGRSPRGLPSQIDRADAPVVRGRLQAEGRRELRGIGQPGMLLQMAVAASRCWR